MIRTIINVRRLGLWTFARAFLCVCSLAFAAAPSFSNFNDDVLASASGGTAKGGPFCGLMCFYFAARVCGRSVAYLDLFNNKYINSEEGSSIANIQAASADYGLHSLALGNIDEAFIRGASSPIILHVRAATDNFKFNHFILYLGEKSGMARVYDPMTPSHLVPFDELMGRSDGLALILSDHPISARKEMERQFAGMFYWIATLIVLILMIVMLSGLRSDVRRFRSLPAALVESSRQIINLLALAAGAAFLSQFRGGIALAAQGGPAASIQRENIGSLLPQANLVEMRKAIDADAVVIDARYAEDYRHGHIPGAISIPVNSTRDERQMAMKGIAWDAHIIVYCESAQCRFSDEIAGDLKDDGFVTLSIFREGWRGWDEAAGK